MAEKAFYIHLQVLSLFHVLTVKVWTITSVFLIQAYHTDTAFKILHSEYYNSIITI